MWGFRRLVMDYLTSIHSEAVLTSLHIETANRVLGVIVSNQELFDTYAAKIAEQNSQIRAAVTLVLDEINKLQQQALSVTETPLDTSSMDAALEQLTAAVDQVEAIPAPVATPDGGSVEVPVEQPVTEPPVEQAPVEEPAVEEPPLSDPASDVSE